jgi:hypothetical protein
MMQMNRLIRKLACLVPLYATCWAQFQGAQQEMHRAPQQAQNAIATLKPKAASTARDLRPVASVLAKDEVSVGFADLACDQDGNIYLGIEGGGGSTVIKKISPQGELVTRFEPYTNPDVDVLGAGPFALSPDGELSMWAGNRKDGFFYILSFASDGHFKRATKLDPGVPWVPASLAVFPNGNFLMTGQVGDGDLKKPMIPFTAIFRADGKLLKEVSLEDDGRLYDLAAQRDPKLTSTAAPNNNRAISWGQAQAAANGNIYVMRWISPAVFYVISPGGAVLRRFTVDAGNASLMPVMMHISGAQIAVLFRNESTKEQLVKIVNLEGEEVAEYGASSHGEKPAIGAAFACYSSKHTQFTFLASDDSRHIMLRTFEPR